MSKKKIIIGAVIVVVLALFVSGGVFAAHYMSVTGGQEEGVIAENIYIGEIDVSGMTAEEAKEAVNKYIYDIGEKKITLTEEENGESVDFTVNDLGLNCTNLDKAVTEAVEYGKDGTMMEKYNTLKDLQNNKKVIDMDIAVNEENIEKIVQENSEKFETPAIEATFSRENGEFIVTDDQTGIKVDIEESIARINEYMSSDWSSDRDDVEILLAVEVDEPEMKAEDLRKINSVLGECSTNIGGSTGGRVKNIVTGTSLIDGTLVMPGEEVSANALMEPYTYDNGYAMAGSYENGEVVDSMGGGICQVSSTLYNALLGAEVEITERQEHSMTVGYLPLGKDAAIAGTWKDLKFRNDYDTPIYIEGFVSGGYLYFKIWGEEVRDENRTVEYVSVRTSTKEPEVTYKEDGGLALGEMKVNSAGQTGGTADLYKVVYVDGVEVSRDKVHTSVYAAGKRVILVGTSSADEQAVSEVKAAIAANDEAAINAAKAAADQRKQEAEDAERRKQEEADRKKQEEEDRKKQEEDAKKNQDEGPEE